MKAVKATLLISWDKKHRYGKLKYELANNYLLSTGQYANTLEKAVRILGTYQVSNSSMPFSVTPKKHQNCVHQTRRSMRLGTGWIRKGDWQRGNVC
jgi:hypothetical protein